MRVNSVKGTGEGGVQGQNFSYVSYQSGRSLLSDTSLYGQDPLSGWVLVLGVERLKPKLRRG